MRALLLMCLILVVASKDLKGQRNCGAMDHLQHQMEQDPKRATKLLQIENHTKRWIKTHKDAASRDIITIPVVIHVVYRTESENLSEARLQEQIDVLNSDYRRLNSDSDGTWSQAADVEIEFCLASIDPDGNETNGITRTATTVPQFGTNDAVKSASSGGKNAWPSTDYLNFWVCNIGGGILGYAQFPGGNPATDGVVNDYRYTGITGASAPFNLGRTATHEVGHWLNLRHIWGDGGCGVDDFVADTPMSDNPNYGCTTAHVSCGSTDMVQNFMDYSDDVCMNLFTSGQKARMLALFAPGGAKESLLSSMGCGNGNPPPPPPGCDNSIVNVTITFDNYPEETTWSITDSIGTQIATGGPYGGEPDGSTLTEEFCLIGGCYDFTINDSYGDGICCSYGTGSYSVTMDSISLANGASFGTTETTNICIEDIDPTVTTCADGVQNGDETGIDCGGPDCNECPTCNDGILNGNETNVDCGGTDCEACPTCNDGLQNGNETGVDCGGPDCETCPTCDDGVLNGNETNVDCGGTDCEECPTCDDGLQNGNETGVDCGGPDCNVCPTCNDGILNGDESSIDCGGIDCEACPTCDDGVLNGNETDIDCGGPDCEECPTNGCIDNEATLTIVLDNYPGETTWSITNAGGTILYTGGPYSTVGATIIENFCLLDGCFDFTINDSYGDGICCSYGQGSFNILNADGNLISGGQFGNTITNNFCLGITPEPTCTDGEQNGNETGVDCGGPDCENCPTCNDGTQNGNETGIDCGGPDCEDCDTSDGDGDGSSEILGSYFESGLDGWITGGSDSYRYNGPRSYEGNYSIRIRDNSAAASSLTSPFLDLASYGSVDVSFYFYPNSMEEGEDFWLRYDDGSGWQTIATWTSGTDFENDIFYSSTVTLSAANYNFGDGDRFRFQCDASGNADRVYIDQIIISSNSGNTRSSNHLIALEHLNSPISILDEKEGENIGIYPNPASNFINIVSEETITNLLIRDVSGQLLTRKTLSNSTMDKLDISELNPGIYLITIETEDNITTKKFVKH